MKTLKKILLLLIIAYLFISSIYILLHINFGDEPEIVGMGFSESNNLTRIIMGLPKTYSTYEGVSPYFLLEVFIKIAIAIILIRALNKNRQSQK